MSPLLSCLADINCICAPTEPWFELKAYYNFKILEVLQEQ